MTTTFVLAATLALMSGHADEAHATTDPLKQESLAPAGPMGFVENKGQVVNQHAVPNHAVRYLLNTDGINVQLRDGGFSYDTYVMEGDLAPRAKYHRVDVHFEQANAGARIVTADASADYMNYYGGQLPEAGATHVHHFGKVTYRDIYDHIDVEFTATGDADKPFEYNFIVRPGGNVADIRMRYEGAPVSLLDGRLSFDLRQGRMEEYIPESWYATANGKVPVQASYTQTAPNTFGFVLPEQHVLAAGHTLVIDPAPVRHWGTYFQGTPTGSPVVFNHLTTDAAGMIYAVGYTRATSNIATAGAHQTDLLSDQGNAIVVKFNDTGNRVWGTYYGGTNVAGDDATNANAVTIDGMGNVIVGGNTRSPNGIATTGAHQEDYEGGRDGFLVKFNSDGIRQWGTYYGGSSSERIRSVIVGNDNKIIIAGDTRSSNNITTLGSHQPSKPGTDWVAFAVQFNADGVRQWGTYYGGDNTKGYSISVDEDQNVYMAGHTRTAGIIATPGAHQETRASTSTNYDAYLVKFNGTGVRQWGTYYGGVAGSATGWAIANDVFGNVYLSGTTSADNGIATLGAHQASFGGGESDAFVVKFAPDGTRLWGTYYGGDGSESSGSGLDKNSAMATDRIGKVVYLAGATTSAMAMSTPGAHQEELLSITGTPRQAYLAMFSAEDGAREWGTYYGGGESTSGASGVSIDPLGRIYLSGVTGGFSGPSGALGTPGVHQEIRSGTGVAGFLARFGTITADAGADTTTCLGVATVIGGQPSAYGSDGPFTYQWTPVTGLNDATAANPVANPSVTTTYTLLATNGMGLTDEASVTVTILPLPTADAGEDGTICQGASITLNGSGSGNAPIVAYQWSPTIGLIQPQTATPVASPTVTTVYTLTVTDANGCQHSDDVTVTVIPLPPAPQLGGGAAYCAGDAIADLTASGIGNGFTWFSDAALTTQVGTGQTLSPAASIGVQTYHVIETLNGCDGPSASVTVTVFALPTANAGADVEVCLNSSVQLNGSGGVSYAWSPATGLSQTGVASPFASPSVTTTYALTVTDANGCTDDDVVTVTVLSLPVADAGQGGEICQGDGWPLNGSGGVSYSWTPATGLSQADVASPVASPDATSTYVLTVTDGNGCQGTDEVTVSVIPLPAPPSVGADANYCEGDVVADLTASGSDLQWYLGTVQGSPVGTGPSFTPADNVGVHVYHVTQTVGGCTGPSAMVSVTVNPFPVADAGQDVTICQGSGATLNGSGGMTYLWSPSTGLSQTDVADPVASPESETTYTLTASNNGCDATATMTVSVNPTPLAPTAGTDAAYCSGDAVTDLTAEGAGGDLTWYSDAAMTVQTGAGTAFTPSAEVGVHSYFVTETSGGCESISAAVTVTVHALPDAGFTAANSGLTVFFSPFVPGLSSYDWQFGDDNGSDQPSPQHLYEADGTYTVTLTVGDANGCIGTYSQEIEVTGVGIHGLASSLGRVTIFPNPTDGVLHVRFDRGQERVTLRVNDMYGRTVHERALQPTDQHLIDMGGLAAGVYHLVLTDINGASGSFKVVRQ
jgi:hypothetical protein